MHAARRRLLARAARDAAACRAADATDGSAAPRWVARTRPRGGAYTNAFVPAQQCTRCVVFGGLWQWRALLALPRSAVHAGNASATRALRTKRFDAALASRQRASARPPGDQSQRPLPTLLSVPASAAPCQHGAEGRGS